MKNYPACTELNVFRVNSPDSAVVVYYLGIATDGLLPWSHISDKMRLKELVKILAK